MQKDKAWKRLLGVSVVAALFGAIAVHAQAQSQAQQGSSDKSGAASGGQSTTAGKLSRTDQRLMIDMAMANMAEIDTAKLAQSKSQNEQVKNFAQQMIDDHTRALNDVQQLAQAKGVTLPSAVDARHKASEDRLARLSGDAFDKAYLAQAGVSEHKKTHNQLKQIEARAKDPDLKALAARVLPTVDQHLNAVQQLRGNGATATGRSGTLGTTGSGSDTTRRSSGTSGTGDTGGSSGSSGTSGTSGSSGTSGTSGSSGTNNNPGGGTR